MTDHLKTWIPVALALLGATFALYGRLASIEKSIAVIEWRLDYSLGPPPWKQPQP